MKLYFKLNRRVKTIITHISVWGLAMIASLLEMSDYDITFDLMKVNFPVWLSYAVVFYVSYLYLTPKLLFKKHNIIYVLLSFVLLTSSFVALKSWYQFMRANEFEQYISKVINTAPARQYLSYSNGDSGFKEDFRKYPSSPSRRGFEEELRMRESMIKRLFNPHNFNPFSPRNVGIIYGILFVFSLSIIIRFFERTKLEERRNNELQKEKISSELEYLKQQINPHFLFNALNSIYSLTILNSENSSDAVLKLSSILRYMLYQTDKDKVQLSDEIEVLENYLGLQQLRLTSKTVVNFVKEGNFDPYRIEPMLLIPILENAFKYGVDSSTLSHIDISLKVHNYKLYFDCTNKIVKQNDNAKNSGIGIKNIRRRLDLLYEDSDYKFTTISKDNNFYVELIL
ncbi:MAG: histidine kinase, partial [Rikenellaceae bacterium]